MMNRNDSYTFIELLSGIIWTFIKLLSVIVYGVIIWGNAGVSSLRKIEVIQNRILRLIFFTQLKDHVRVNTLYKKLGIVKIHDIYTKEVCRLMHLFHDNKLPNAYKTYFRQ